MTRKSRPAARSWRWRENSLKRRSDTVEAWGLTLMWVLAVLGGALTGLFVAQSVESTLDAQRAEVQRVTAVLTADTPARTPVSDGPDDSRVPALVRWTDHEGVKHTAKTLVDPGKQVGATVVVWTDSRGKVAPTPPTSAAATYEAVAGGVLAACGTGGTVFAAGAAARWGLDRGRMAQWEKEWEAFDAVRGRNSG
jgi:hypothetical protein